MKRAWIQLKDFKKAKTLLILPCNAAACIGNYFKAEFYSKRKWNTWREADANLRDLREKGRVVFAAVDSSTLETQPGDLRGAIVLETEMCRVRNPEGEDWGAPSWRWFRPTAAGKWKHLEELTDALINGVRRVKRFNFHQVIAMVNPRAYFLALAAAVDKCGLSKKWALFRIPAHPRHLLPAVRKIAPIVRASNDGNSFKGGIYPIPDLYPALIRESKAYKNRLPAPWKKYNQFQSAREVKKRWGPFIMLD